MRILLDTNIIAALFKGDAEIADKIDKTPEVYIPIIVLGELYYGAYYSKHVERNLDNILLLSKRYKILGIDEDTASVYGQVKAKLRKNGTPIPENDVWIGTIALQHDYVLITRDKHFKEIEGLKIKHW